MNMNYYPKNFGAHGWGWHRGSAASAAVRGFLKKERGSLDDPSASGSHEPLIGRTGGLYPALPTEDDTLLMTGGGRLYPSLPAEEYESGAVEEVVEESCASVNVNLVAAGKARIHRMICVGKNNSEHPRSEKKKSDAQKNENTSIDIPEKTILENKFTEHRQTYEEKENRNEQNKRNADNTLEKITVEQNNNTLTRNFQERKESDDHENDRISLYTKKTENG